jgi:Tfp pilus assembly protein PilO
MNTYKEQLQELQQFAFDIIKEYPIDKEAANVLAELANANNQDRIKFFELNKGEDTRKVFYDLASSGSIAKWLDNYALVAYIND